LRIFATIPFGSSGKISAQGDHERDAGKVRVIFGETLQKWRCDLIEFKGEADHVHLLIRTNPAVQLSKLVNNLKTVSSRLIRRDFKGQLSRIHRKPVFWHR
jgi:putative transposase